MFGRLIELKSMPRTLTAADIIPLVASLPDVERRKLLKWIALPYSTDASAYSAVPPLCDDFLDSEEPLAWEADGWDEFR